MVGFDNWYKPLRMPLEGHFQRQRTPLRQLEPRERWIVRVAAALVAVGIVVAVVAALASSGAKTPAGCVAVTTGSTTGGVQLRRCGQDAAQWCREERALDTPLARAVQSACRQARIRDF